jgi:hypothetical protein
MWLPTRDGPDLPAAARTNHIRGVHVANAWPCLPSPFRSDARTSRIGVSSRALDHAAVLLAVPVRRRARGSGGLPETDPQQAALSEM